MIKRREFIKGVALTAAALSLPVPELLARKPGGMRLGLVTYQWGKDWDVPTIIRNCEQSGVLGVELRTQHKHGVEPVLTASQRREVKKRFADSQVTVLGYGSNEQFDSPDPAVVRKHIENTKALLQLSQDIGGSGVKVKPNGFHPGVPHEKTLEQIGRALNEVGKAAGELGQQIRLEVHGHGTQEIPNIRRIMDVADNRHVTVCWNSNPTDLQGQGLEYNFNLLKDRFGDTVHVREMDSGPYPFDQLINLFVKMNYKGWLLLECSTEPADKVAAMTAQRKHFDKMMAQLARR